MLSSVKTLVITVLLLLSGTATAAPAAIPSPAPAPVLETADQGISSNDVHDFKLTFLRFKDEDCQRQKHMGHTIQSGKCRGFKHSFHTFSLSETFMVGRKEYWGRFASCSLTVYADKHCRKEVLAMPDINSGSDMQECGHLSPGLRAQSVMVHCEKYGD